MPPSKELTDFQQQVYNLICNDLSITVSEMSRELDTTRGVIYDALNRLVLKGYLVAVEKTPSSWILTEKKD